MVTYGGKSRSACQPPGGGTECMMSGYLKYSGTGSPSCFILEVEHGFQNENLTFELLLLNNSRCLEELKNAYLRVVPFMPPNTTSLIQPLDQGIF